jgi:hypothetical protein
MHVDIYLSSALPIVGSAYLLVAPPFISYGPGRARHMLPPQVNSSGRRRALTMLAHRAGAEPACGGRRYIHRSPSIHVRISSLQFVYASNFWYGGICMLEIEDGLKELLVC